MIQDSPVKIWRNQKIIRELLGRRGEVLVWTIVRVPPAGFENQAPYIVALIKLSDGRVIPCQLVDCPFDDMKKGLEVRLVVRRIREADPEGIIPYGIKASPWVMKAHI